MSKVYFVPKRHRLMRPKSPSELISTFGLLHYLPFNNEGENRFVTLKDYIGTNDGAVVSIPCLSVTVNGAINVVDSGVYLDPNSGEVDLIFLDKATNITNARYICGFLVAGGFIVYFNAGSRQLNAQLGAYTISNILTIDLDKYYHINIVYAYPGNYVVTVNNLTDNTTVQRTNILSTPISQASTFKFGSLNNNVGLTAYCRIKKAGETFAEWLCAEGKGGVVYDVSGNDNHVTINSTYVASAWDYSQSIINELPKRGYEIYENGTGGKIQVPYRNFAPFKITPTIAGYTKTRDMDTWGGGINCNVSYIDFNPTENPTPPAQIAIWNRNNEDIWTDDARASYDPTSPYRWGVNELNLDTILSWIKGNEYKGKIYIYNKFDGSNLVAISDILVFSSNLAGYKIAFNNFFKNLRDT